MPIWCAFSVIDQANRDSLPPRYSATAAAMSFADFVTNARIAFSTEMLWPGLSPSLVGGCDAACAEIGRVSSSVTEPLSSASNSR